MIAFVFLLMTYCGMNSSHYDTSSLQLQTKSGLDNDDTRDAKYIRFIEGVLVVYPAGGAPDAL